MLTGLISAWLHGMCIKLEWLCITAHLQEGTEYTFDIPNLCNFCSAQNNCHNQCPIQQFYTITQM